MCLECLEAECAREHVCRLPSRGGLVVPGRLCQPAVNGGLHVCVLVSERLWTSIFCTGRFAWL